MSKVTTERFFHFVRYSMGIDDVPPEKMETSEWISVYDMASAHALLGICANGIERMDDSLRPPLTLTMRWAMNTIKIEKRNILTNRKCAELTGMLEADGLKGCVLKGQGAALYYPNPSRRQSGDIDIWVPGGHRRIMNYVRNRFPSATAYYHHADFPVFKEVPVEVHFFPSWMCNPFYNRRLQRWFREQADEQFYNVVSLPGSNELVAVPTTRFNVVYMLLHIYRHLFHEGIGLRQCMDYYYVLKAFSDVSPAERKSVVGEIRRLGLYRFARAMMYVLGEVFAMPAEWMIVSPSENDGSMVLAEIVRSGNFGINSGIDRENGKSLNFFATKIGYRMRFFRRYPGEVLWGFVFSLWGKWWRAYHHYGKQH